MKSYRQSCSHRKYLGAIASTSTSASPFPSLPFTREWGPQTAPARWLPGTFPIDGHAAPTLPGTPLYNAMQCGAAECGHIMRICEAQIEIRTRSRSTSGKPVAPSMCPQR